MPIVWSLPTVTDVSDVPAVVGDAVADEALFDISQSGVLTFTNPPNYEVAVGGTANDSNTYRVVVQASDVENVSYFEVTVTVTDVEETGKVTWTVTLAGGAPLSLLQFQPRAVLTASVTDPDAVTDVNDGPD